MISSSGSGAPTEICVDPREVVAGLPAWLAETFGVEFRFDDPVLDVRTNAVTARRRPDRGGDGSGSAPGTRCGCSFPDLLRQSGLVRCKLQMMRSQPFGDEWADRPDARRRA